MYSVIYNINVMVISTVHTIYSTYTTIGYKCVWSLNPDPFRFIDVFAELRNFIVCVLAYLFSEVKHLNI